MAWRRVVLAMIDPTLAALETLFLAATGTGKGRWLVLPIRPRSTRPLLGELRRQPDPPSATDSGTTCPSRATEKTLITVAFPRMHCRIVRHSPPERPALPRPPLRFRRQRHAPTPVHDTDESA